jgi:O-antigen/teichoic acid export membrane protein
MRDILKGSFIIFIFKVFGAVSLFLTYILIPRYYGVETLGVFNLISALVMIGTTVSRVGLDIYVVRMIPSLEGKQIEISLFLKEVFRIITLGSVVVSILFFLSSDIIDRYIFKSIDASNYIRGLVLIILPFTFFNIFPEIFRGFHDIKIYSFFRNLSQNLLMVLLLGIGILVGVEYSPIYMLYSAITFITIVMAFVLYRFLKKRGVDIGVEGRYQGAILRYSYPMFLTSSVMFLMGYVDSFMISYYLDEYQVGIYSVCLNLSMVITFIPIAIGGFISPKISQAYSKGDTLKVKEIFANSMKLITVVTIPIFAMLYSFPELFLGIFGDEFKVAVTTLFIVNLGFLSEAMTGPVGFILNMTDNQHIFMRILIVALIINIVLNALLIPIYGINGAAIAILSSMLFWTISSFVVLKKRGVI